MTRTFNNKEELMIALLNGEKWTLNGNIYFYDEKDITCPFKFRIEYITVTILNEYTYCDGKTLWHKAEDKTELDLLKEKYASGDYIVIFKQKKTTEWSFCYRPYDLEWRNDFNYKLIHKKHKDILDAYLADNKVIILFDDVVSERGFMSLLSCKVDFIDSYSESYLYKLPFKKKTVSLAMFTCYDSRYDTWLPKEVCSSLDSFINKHNYNFCKYHHEIPNTRYEIEVDDA